MKIAINLPLRNEPELGQLIADLYNPQNAAFHHYLTVQQFTDRFSITEEDYSRVVAWLKANGLTIIDTPSNRRLVSVEGTVGAINDTFQIVLNNYKHPAENRNFFAPDREPTTTGLSVKVLQITGLDNFELPHPMLRHAAAQPASRPNGPVAFLTGSGASGNYLPSDMRAAYYHGGTLTGSGQSIGIVSFGTYQASDLTKYYSTTGMSSTVPVNIRAAAGFSGDCYVDSLPPSCDDGEMILDIVNAIGMAPGITQILFYEGDYSTEILNKIASDNIAKVISSSWGWSASYQPSDDPVFKEFIVQGVTFLNASGDYGSYDSSTYNFPQVDPYVTVVGGTHLVTTGPAGAWSSETAWTRSGGGYVVGTAIPAWQQASGVINSSNNGSASLRNSPDIAAEADFDNITVSYGTVYTGEGGTSFATPRWAGLIAIANEQAQMHGRGYIGFLNPSIYKIGAGSSSPAPFHDITSGSNPPAAGTATTFSAVTGYDLVTGWGSPNGVALLNDLQTTYSFAALIPVITQLLQ